MKKEIEFQPRLLLGEMDKNGGPSNNEAKLNRIPFNPTA